MKYEIAVHMCYSTHLWGHTMRRLSLQYPKLKLQLMWNIKFYEGGWQEFYIISFYTCNVCHSYYLQIWAETQQ